MEQTHWSIVGSQGEAIHGTTTRPRGSSAKCNLIIAHGFKGYKDYGLFPWLAMTAASSGAVSHGFNFSHSGMLAGDGPFERTDLFEKDTWNKQVEDLQAVVSYCRDEALPTILMGHSRGGVACLLATGRGVIQVDHVVTLSAPCTCNPLSEEMRQTLIADGYIESPSSRTDQMLHVGRCFLDEQLQEPEAHDLLKLVEAIDVPVTVIHGTDDQTVAVESGAAIVKAAKKATFIAVAGGNHVFNTPNPFPIDGEPTQQLQKLWDSVEQVINCC